MGNNQHKESTQTVEQDTEEATTTKRKQVTFQEINNTSFFGKSFLSLTSQTSTYSVSRPWSRVSRKRWKESTLTTPYDSSKTAWPVSQLEAYFLPVFPVDSTLQERKYKVLEEYACGAFGKVYKVFGIEDRKLYALKVLSKSKIIKENAVQQVKEEVQIQSACGHHTFIVNSPCHWQTRKKLYIVSEFISGGELHNLLELYGVLPSVLVKLYVAQLALAIDFLHNAGIIYRDLKPENVLLDLGAHLKLVDFGLSKWLSYGKKTKTFCGTPRYMAPEIVSLQPYGHSCDWWSLGVIACRMLTGQFPTSAMVKNDDVALKKPGSLPEDIELDVPSKDLLLRLLDLDPMRRLHSVRALQTIAFYKDYNFKDVIQKKVSPDDILKEYYPEGPPKWKKMEEIVIFKGFESNSIHV